MTTVSDVLTTHGISGNEAATLLRHVHTVMLDPRMESKRDALELTPFYGDYRDLAVQLHHAHLEIGTPLYTQCVTDLFGNTGVRFAQLAPHIAEATR